MPSFQDNENTVIIGKIDQVLHVAWSRHRAWHGEKVKIQIRTSAVPDGASVDLQIVPKGDDAVIDTPPKQSITASKADHEYTIDWKQKVIPADAGEFVVKAKITEYKLEAEADPLAVDLRKPIFSA